MSAVYNTNKEIPQDMLLGNLLFINLADMKMEATELKHIFKHRGIPESYVRDISSADAYRRASSSIKNRSIVLSDGSRVRVEIDEVRCDSDSIKRIVGIKKIDSTAEDVEYESVGEIIFNRHTNGVVTNMIMHSSDPDYQSFNTLCIEVMNKYQDWAVYHNKDTIRNIINRIITDTHPINLMPTGLCKFTPESSSALLYSLKDALGDMNAYTQNPNQENIMELIPVIDTKEQRNLVNKNFQMEMSDELLGLAMELKDVLQKKQKITSRSAAAYVEKYKFYQEKIKDYESLLNIYAGSLRNQMKEVLDLIDDGKDDSSDV